MQSARHDVGKIASRVLSGASPAEAVVLAWPLVCGAAVAQRAVAFSFHDGTLWVQVPDREWQSQLQAFSAQYSSRLSQLTGTEVRGIRYEVRD